MEFKCSHCRKTSTISPANGVLYLFVKQPWFSWVQFICPKCEQRTDSFLGEGYALHLRRLDELQVGIIRNDFAEPELIAQWESVYSKHQIQERFVSDRELKLVSFFAWLLEWRQDELFSIQADSDQEADDNKQAPTD